VFQVVLDECCKVIGLVSSGAEFILSLLQIAAIFDFTKELHDTIEEKRPAQLLFYLHERYSLEKQKKSK